MPKAEPSQAELYPLPLHCIVIVDAPSKYVAGQGGTAVKLAALAIQARRRRRRRRRNDDAAAAIRDGLHESISKIKISKRRIYFSTVLL
jgi:hypothetical protein